MKNILRGFWSIFDSDIEKVRQNRDVKLISYFISTEENMVKAFNKLKDKHERE